jgi:hypothetical protein
VESLALLFVLGADRQMSRRRVDIAVAGLHGRTIIAIEHFRLFDAP